MSSMLDNVIAKIMDCLPLKDAVATSILSTGWRFNWTLLTQLILDADIIGSLPRHFNKSDAMYKNVVPLPDISSSEVDCSTMGKLQLQNVSFIFIKGLENEVCLIKYILACSPMLKSIEILLDTSIGSNVNEKYKLANKLLKLHRTSPKAEVDIF
uniref:uncharacterized protein LOC122598616 n=1 Tax=Erigeron canadensis TaxID=72917 RepID=UPI001CB9864D|nr:uncharacterized protein LOC122598616 [Erigeron canadensis]